MKGGKPFIFFTGFAGFKERLISRFLCYFLSRAAKPPRKMMLALQVCFADLRRSGCQIYFFDTLKPRKHSVFGALRYQKSILTP